MSSKCSQFPLYLVIRVRESFVEVRDMFSSQFVGDFRPFFHFSMVPLFSKLANGFKCLYLIVDT